MLSRFHLIPERNRQTDRQTDGRTDRQICYINIARSMLTRDKNGIVCRAGKSVIQMLLRGHQMTASQACSCCRENARRSA